MGEYTHIPVKLLMTYWRHIGATPISIRRTYIQVLPLALDEVPETTPLKIPNLMRHSIHQQKLGDEQALEVVLGGWLCLSISSEYRQWRDEHPCSGQHDPPVFLSEHAAYG